jgi:glycosyltransferase involved in cell wall biosynthesis
MGTQAVARTMSPKLITKQPHCREEFAPFIATRLVNIARNFLKPSGSYNSEKWDTSEKAMFDLCIDARMANVSGIGSCIRHLVPFFNQPPFRVILLVHDENQPWCKDFERIHFGAKIYSIREQLLFPLIIPRCDLFWSPHYNVPRLPIRAKKRIVTIHDACHLSLGHLLSWPEKLYAKSMMNYAMHHSDAIATVSFFSREELIRFLGHPKNEMAVISNGLNRCQFQRIVDNQTLENLRKKYRLPNQFVLFVGNCKPHKNLSGLLRAFSLMDSSDFGLVIVGQSKGLRNAGAKIDQKMVFFLEGVPDTDLPGLYSLANLFILPSFYEGFGLPPLEAMSCGCPTIVSAAGSLPEICGNASLYVDPHNHQQIRDAIVKVAIDSDLKSQLIQQGYERIKQFDWEKSAQLYRNIFEHQC